MSYRSRPVVHPTAEDARLDQPLYAVNLLDRERPWAYDLYNLLAFPVARSAGARPLVKGVEGECWIGDAAAARETLLIVGYDEAEDFLRMTGNPYFALISGLRKLGLSGFQFGFSQRLDEGPLPARTPRRRGGELLALLWPDGQGDAPPELADLRRRVSAAGSRLIFVGAKKAILALDHGPERGVAPTRLAPPLPWQSIVVVAGHEKTLRPLADDPPPGLSLAIKYRRVF